MQNPLTAAILIISVLAVLVPTEASAKRNVLKHTIYVNEVVRVVDGDTFKAKIEIWPNFNTEVSIRIRGIDSPEKSRRRAKCRAEIEKAFQAKRFAYQRLFFNKVRITDISLGKYAGRVVAKVEYMSRSGWKDFGKEIMANGLAVKFRTKKPWCRTT